MSRRLPSPFASNTRYPARQCPGLLDLELLQPHPGNPRVVEREDVIAAIEQQIRNGGFDPSHAILVRPVDGRYQILSDHNRTTAAGRAGLTQIPAWVREMDDASAFMQLVLANAQGELSPLERGLHALAATESGQKIREYALQVGRSKSMVQVEVSAARVALSTQVDKSQLVGSAKHLAEIHAAPQHCWPALVGTHDREQLDPGGRQTAVRAINKAKPPENYEGYFDRSRLQEMIARGENAAEVMQHSARKASGRPMFPRGCVGAAGANVSNISL